MSVRIQRTCIHLCMLFLLRHKGYSMRIIAKIDDDMLKYYCNEDLFLLDIKQVEGDDAFEVTLIELMDH
ncbi:hypothetical protein B7P43_G05900 [Cryptotermes secundus]|uniref:GRHL1/CP2 C-terminal domain-containing protein n=1 Tax=Cryptotermes secundus TaxID=105785 RepID=A0A2J7RIG4_9NEOP|nr:hypothetical protein B7P43_G05900 [Cryptotermes secundus]